MKRGDWFDINEEYDKIRKTGEYMSFDFGILIPYIKELIKKNSAAKNWYSSNVEDVHVMIWDYGKQLQCTNKPDFVTLSGQEWTRKRMKTKHNLKE